MDTINIYPDDLLVRYHERVTEALRRAVRDALIMHKRIGNPIAGWNNGKVVLIAPERITIEGDTITITADPKDI